MQCLVALCNNCAICNTLQAAVNCNAICNTSYYRVVFAARFVIYYKLRQNFKLNRRKKIQQQNASIKSYLTMTSATHQSIRARHLKILNQHYIWLQHYVFLSPRFNKSGNIRTNSSLRLSVCPSVCHNNFNLAHIFCSIRLFCIHDPGDKSFHLALCSDLDPDL